MVKYREILRLDAMGVSRRNIAFSCGCSRNTVKGVLDKSAEMGLRWPLPEDTSTAARLTVEQWLTAWWNYCSL